MLCNRRRALTFAALPLLGLTSCARLIHSRHADRNTRIQAIELPRDGSPADRISESDLVTVQGMTATDAVRQLRPTFLRPGGPPATPFPRSVYVDGNRAGGLDVLDLIPLGEVREIRYLEPVAAKSVFGSYCSCDGGVLLVRTRRVRRE